MIPIIAHIYGPFALHGYGLGVAIGLLLFYSLLQRDPKCSNLITPDQLANLLMIGIIAGIIGGRTLFVLSNPESMTLHEMFRVWEGGLSFLGALIAILVSTPIYLKKIKVPLLPMIDIAAVYVPLLYACARIGCFLAGCCYGLPSNLPWAITYTHPASRAPLCMSLHPTQLYSVLFSLGIFIILQMLKKRLTRPGQLLSTYLILASIERFSIDFLRNDRIFIPTEGGNALFSIDQWVAIFILITGLIMLLLTSRRMNSRINQKTS